MKSFKIIAFAACAAFAFADAAEAKETFVAKLEAPVAKKEKVVADKTVWICEADACTALVKKAATVRSCKALADEVGRISAYGPADQPLTAEALAKCNTGAKATLQASN